MVRNSQSTGASGPVKSGVKGVDDELLTGPQNLGQNYQRPEPKSEPGKSSPSLREMGRERGLRAEDPGRVFDRLMRPPGLRGEPSAEGVQERRPRRRMGNGPSATGQRGRPGRKGRERSENESGGCGGSVGKGTDSVTDTSNLLIP